MKRHIEAWTITIALMAIMLVWGNHLTVYALVDVLCDSLVECQH